MILKKQISDNMKISGVYKITNTVTGDFYVGSSKDIKNRWTSHKCKCIWNRCPNNPMYLDMKKYGVNKFEFQVIAEVEGTHLKETEQKFIEMLKPTYNSNNANGLDIERYNEYQKEYHKSEKYKEYKKEYQKSEKYKETQRKANNKYQNQLCLYNGEVLTLNALRIRFKRAGVEHPTLEAKQYLQNI